MRSDTQAGIAERGKSPDCSVIDEHGDLALIGIQNTAIISKGLLTRVLLGSRGTNWI